MWKKQSVFVAGVVVCGFLAFQAASRLAAQQSAGPSKPDAKSDRDKEERKGFAVDLSYAKAYLDVMKATESKYEELNRNQPNTIPPSVMQVIQDGVHEARERYELLQNGEIGGSQICVACAESKLGAARESLKRADEANAVSAGSVSTAQVGLLKANFELAKARVEKARHLANESPMSTAHFELGQLREELLELQMQVALLRERS